MFIFANWTKVTARVTPLKDKAMSGPEGGESHGGNQAYREEPVVEVSRLPRQEEWSNPVTKIKHDIKTLLIIDGQAITVKIKLFGKDL